MYWFSSYFNFINEKDNKLIELDAGDDDDDDDDNNESSNQLAEEVFENIDENDETRNLIKYFGQDEALNELDFFLKKFETQIDYYYLLGCFEKLFKFLKIRVGNVYTILDNLIANINNEKKEIRLKLADINLNNFELNKKRKIVEGENELLLKNQNSELKKKIKELKLNLAKKKIQIQKDRIKKRSLKKKIKNFTEKQQN